MSPFRSAERRLLRAVERRLDDPRPPGRLLRRLGPPYLKARHLALHRTVLSGRLWVPSAWRIAVVFALRPGDCCLDLGANIGRVAQEAAWRVGAEGSVHCFEPSPEAAARLRRRLRRLGLEQVRVNECAVADQSGAARLHEYAVRDGGASSLRPQAHVGTPPASVREVVVVALDDYAERQGLDGVALIKIDVEGAEVEAIRGARRLLGRVRPRPVLVVEAAPVTQAGFGRRVRDVLDVVHELGYATWACRPEGLAPIRSEEDLPAHRRREDLLALDPRDHDPLLRRISRLAERRAAR